MSTVEHKEKETLGFQAEIKDLLKLMINSIYSNKEIFLRELVSNASDAIDKLKFASLTNQGLYEDSSDLKIWVEFNKDRKTITVRDNGIGMTRDEVVNHLGTIAKSGTRDFFSKLTGDKAKDSQLIGQFGVGFYSAFIVADKVEVITRKAGVERNQGVKWESQGHGEFTVESVNKELRGTEVILHIKDDSTEFLNDWTLRQIIHKYSDHISAPIVMHKIKEPKADADDKADNKTGDAKIIDIPEEEVINKAQALWLRNKQDISENEYKEFYKHIAHDFQDPLTWLHAKVEGKLEYAFLVYIPSRAPFDLWYQYQNKARGLKLYVKRVFIMDDAEQFLPNYLRFVRGVIDSSDLPLNISREILQNNKITDSMRSGVTKKILSMLDTLSQDAEKYQKFWKEFGLVLKEGPAEDHVNKDEIAKLLRFASTFNNTAEQTVSLKDYLSRLKENQDKIYYITGDSFNTASNSPQLEIFRKKGIEVLILNDKIDEWLMMHLTEFEGKKFQSVAKGALELDKTEETNSETKAQEEQFKDLIGKMKDVLKDVAKDVRISSRLTDSPACIIADENDMTIQMQKILKAAGQQVPKTMPILEVNPDHPLVQRIKSEEANQKRFADLCLILFEQAVLAEGGQLTDPASFVKRFNNLLLEVI